MQRYTKVISLIDMYFIKEYKKIKHHKDKVRAIREETVAKEFKKGNTEILIYFAEKDEEFLITPDTDEETIQRYLGKKFLK